MHMSIFTDSFGVSAFAIREVLSILLTFLPMLSLTVAYNFNTVEVYFFCIYS